MTRGERRARTDRIVKRRMRQARQETNTVYRDWSPWPHPDRAGRARKLSPFDCGNPKCGVCSPHHCDKGARKALYERQAAKQGAA